MAYWALDLLDSQRSCHRALSIVASQILFVRMIIDTDGFIPKAVPRFLLYAWTESVRVLLIYNSPKMLNIEYVRTGGEHSLASLQTRIDLIRLI